MSLIEVAVNSCFFDSAIHPFNLPVRPGMLGFGQAMVNTMLFADTVKQQLKSIFISGTIGELNAIIGQNRMNFVGNSRNEISQELDSYGACCPFMKFHQNKL